VDGPKSARHEHNCVRNATSASYARGWITVTEPRAKLRGNHAGRLLAGRPGERTRYTDCVHPSPRQPMDLISSSRPPRGRPCWWTARAGRRKAMRRDGDASAGVAVAGIVPASRPLALPPALMSADGTASDGTRHEALRSRSAGATARRAAASPAKNPARARTVDLPLAGRPDPERDRAAVRMPRHSSCSPPVGRGPRGRHAGIGWGWRPIGRPRGGMGQGGGARRGVIALTGPGGAAWSPRRVRDGGGGARTARPSATGIPRADRARAATRACRRAWPAADGRRGLARPSRGPARARPWLLHYWGAHRDVLVRMAPGGREPDRDAS